MNGLTGIFVFSTSYPMQWHSVSQAIMASFRIQASSHTWLRSQFPSHFLHLEAPTRVISSQQRLWKWEMGEQIPHDPPSFPKLLWLGLLPSQPSWWQQPDELEETVGHCKSAGHRQPEWKQLPVRSTVFPVNLLTEELCCDKSSSDLPSLSIYEHQASKDTLHIRSHTLNWSIYQFNINFGAESIKCKWKWKKQFSFD